MSKFTLFTQILNPKHEQSVPTSGIQYQEYEVEVDNKLTTLCVPIKETENFEQALTQYEVLTEQDVRLLLRQHRGIRG